MAGGRHRRPPAGSHAQVVNLVGACLLMLIAGSTYSLSIFSPSMDALPGSGAGAGAGAGEEAQHPLAGVWSSSLGLMSLVSAPAMLAAGLVLSATPIGGGSRSRLARWLSLTSATCFGCLALAAAAASRRSAAAVTLAVAVQGVALGIYYLLAVELLAAWAPRRRTGLATGVGMTAFGAGGMVFAAVFAALVRHLGAVGAVYATAALWAVPCLTLTPWLSFPPDVDGPDAGGGWGGDRCSVGRAATAAARDRCAGGGIGARGRGYGSVPSSDGGGDGQPRWRPASGHPPLSTGPARSDRPPLHERPSAEVGGCDYATNGSLGRTVAAASSNGDARPVTRRTGVGGVGADGKAEPSAVATAAAVAPAAPPGGGGASGTALPWSSLLTLHQFWLYMYVCLVGQLGFGACLPWFFSTTGVFFDTPTAAAAAGLPLKFAIMNGVGIAARLAGGIAVDVLVVPGSTWLWSGAKNSLVLLMVVQTGAFLTMAALSSATGSGGFGAFFAALVTLYVAFSATAGNLAVLSREVFSPANGSAVFGVAAGLMMGVGEAVSASGIAVLNFEGRRAVAAGTAMGSLTADGVPRSAYNAYYLAAAAASAVALVATLVTHRVEAAFEARLPDGSVGVLVDVTDLAAGTDGSEAGAADAATAVATVAASAVASPAADDAAVVATMAVPVGADGRPCHPTRPLVAVPGSTLDLVNDSAQEEDEWDSSVEEDDDDFTLVSSYKAAFSLRDRVYVARPKAVPGPATYAGPSAMDKARGPPA
ncbi:hypothetical protein MMPV_008591 [Pyropia vietnamensis]